MEIRSQLAATLRANGSNAGRVPTMVFEGWVSAET